MKPVAIDIACRAERAWRPPATSSEVAVIPSERITQIIINCYIDRDTSEHSSFTEQSPEQSLEARRLGMSVGSETVNDERTRVTGGDEVEDQGQDGEAAEEAADLPVAHHHVKPHLLHLPAAQPSEAPVDCCGAPPDEHKAVILLLNENLSPVWLSEERDLILELAIREVSPGPQ